MPRRSALTFAWLQLLTSLGLAGMRGLAASVLSLVLTGAGANDGPDTAKLEEAQQHYSRARVLEQDAQWAAASYELSEARYLDPEIRFAPREEYERMQSRIWAQLDKGKTPVNAETGGAMEATLWAVGLAGGLLLCGIGILRVFVPRAEKGIEAIRAASVSALDKAAKLRRLRDLEKIKVFPNVVQVGEAQFSMQEIASFRVVDTLSASKCYLTLRDGQASSSVVVPKDIGSKCGAEANQALKTYRASNEFRSGEFLRCTFIGGTGLGLTSGKRCCAIFGKSLVSLVEEGGRCHDVTLASLLDLKLDGPGRVTSGATFIGGGVGLEGAVQGIGAAALLNALTSKTTTNTILYFRWSSGEAYLHLSSHSPSEARLLLSQAFTTVINGRPESAPVDLASQLERLNALFESRAISADEFAVAKAKLLA